MEKILDFTSLKGNETEQDIWNLVFNARKYKSVYSVCVYPQWVSYLSQNHQPTKICTVINFPYGTTTNINEILFEVDDALINGVDEIDLVFPSIIEINNYKFSGNVVRQVKNLLCRYNSFSSEKILKVIIESGEIQSKDIIESTAVACGNGADFIKTSTGKTKTGATISDATLILSYLNRKYPNVGFKASGGIKTKEQAQSYIDLAKQIRGENSIKPELFRIGTSVLWT